MLSKEQIKLNWLMRVRWGAVGAWGAVALIVWWSQRIEVTAWPMFLFLTATTVSNFFVASIPTQRERFLKWGGWLLASDILLLSALLYSYGGYANPFSMMFLVYVTLAAFILNAAWTWWIFALSSAAFTTLFIFHIPLPGLEVHHHGGGGGGFDLHLHGMLIAFFVIGTLTCLFLTRMSKELELQEESIQELKQQRVLEEKFLAIASLAAGAAHELSTPIGTLSLIAEDMMASLRGDPRWGGDLRLMNEQIERCNSILNRMRGEASRESGETLVSCSSTSVLDEISVQFAGKRLTINELPGDFVAFQSALVEVVASLVKNAYQASADNGEVEIDFSVKEDTVDIQVRDSGVGMTVDEVARIGEPFFTTKAPGEGFGLGLFLVKMFAQRLSGTFSVESAPQRGTTARLLFPRYPKRYQEAA